MSRLQQLIMARTIIKRALENDAIEADLMFAARVTPLWRITAEIKKEQAKKEIITYTAPDQSTIPHADYYRRLG
jgi:hypothetical protein